MPRNRELMRVFKDVGLVEQLGSGMSRILKYYDKNIFEISDHFIKVIFPFYLSENEENNVIGDNNGNNTAIGDNNGDNNGDNRDEREIMALLAKKPYITAKEMSMQTGFSTRKISRIMRNLRETGRIVRVGSPRKGYWEIKDSTESLRNLLDINLT